MAPGPPHSSELLPAQLPLPADATATRMRCLIVALPVPVDERAGERSVGAAPAGSLARQQSLTCRTPHPCSEEHKRRARGVLPGRPRLRHHRRALHPEGVGLPPWASSVRGHPQSGAWRAASWLHCCHCARRVPDSRSPAHAHRDCHGARQSRDREKQGRVRSWRQTGLARYRKSIAPSAPPFAAAPIRNSGASKRWRAAAAPVCSRVPGRPCSVASAAARSCGPTQSPGVRRGALPTPGGLRGWVPA